MKTAVVTGACGFIGKAMTKKLLEKDFKVFALVTNPVNLNDIMCENLVVIKAFFEEYLELGDKLQQNIDVFYHFAWNGVFGEAFKDYELQLKNTKFSGDAIKLAISVKAKKFVLASTINTLETINHLNKSNIRPRYTNIYATAKIAAEMICKTIAFNEGIEFNVGIIAMVYGENNKSKMLPNVLISNLLYGRESNLIPETTPFDLVYVGDVVEAFYYIGTQGVNQKTYYVGSPKLKTIKEICEEIKQIVNPHGIINYGVYKEENSINYNLINLNELYEDTDFLLNSDFKDNIHKTALWIKESGGFK